MAVLSQVYDIQLIKAARPVDGAILLTLVDGRQVSLAESHPSFPLWMIHIESKLRDRYPVGIVTDESGQVLDLNTAHDTGVAWICEFPTDPNRFRVAFWAYSPICGLSRDQPGFDHLHAVLSAAAGTQLRVWVATHSEETVDDEVDDEGLIAALPRIMEVRAMGSIPTTNGETAAATERPHK